LPRFKENAGVDSLVGVSRRSGMAESHSQFKLLFVCMGNICRSPAAECVMRQLVERDGLEGRVVCDSAGTIDMHTGNTPDDRMQAAGARRGIRIDGAARPVERRDLDSFDLILTMDDENYEDVLAIGGGRVADGRVRRFCDFCREHDDAHVPDPYYGGEDGFEHVLDLLEDGSKQLLSEVRRRLGDQA
jgi:protein-tyrosine phosphatase